jgi:hypothetical protein
MATNPFHTARLNNNKREMVQGSGLNLKHLSKLGVVLKKSRK